MIELRSWAPTRTHHRTGGGSGSAFGPYRSSRAAASALLRPRKSCVGAPLCFIAAHPCIHNPLAR